MRRPTHLTGITGTVLADDAADDGSIGLRIYTGATVRRVSWDGAEYDLQIDLATLDLSRASHGLPLLVDHQAWSSAAVVGRVLPGSVRVTAEGLVGRAALSTVAADAEIVGKIRAHMLDALSIGTTLPAIEEIAAADRTDIADADVPLWLAIGAQPYEVSVVPVGADMSARITLSLALPSSSAGVLMSTQSPSPSLPPVDPVVAPAPAAESLDIERARVGEILSICARHDTPDLVADAISGGASVEAVRAQILERLASASTSGACPPMRSSAGETGTERLAGDLTAALDLRLGRSRRVAPAGATAEARRLSARPVVDHARAWLAQLGDQQAWSRDPYDVLRRASPARSGPIGRARAGIDESLVLDGQRTATLWQTPGDFASILANSLGKSLLASYDEVPVSYPLWTRSVSLTDLRARVVARISGTSGPTVRAVGAPTAYGVLADGSESWTPAEYGDGVQIDRQVLINDDLSAIDGAMSLLAAGFARNREQLAVAILTANAAMSDGVVLYTPTGRATSNEVASGTGGAPSVAQLSLIRQRLASQVDDSGQLINPQLSVVLVPSALADIASQVIDPRLFASSTLTGAPTAWMQALTVASSPYLDATSAAVWYGFASPGVRPAIEIGSVGGAGPEFEVSTDFDTGGIKWRGTDFVGAGAVDYRTTVRNMGA